MSLRLHSDRTCLVIACLWCEAADGRIVELNVPLSRSREALQAMREHDADCHPADLRPGLVERLEPGCVSFL